MLHRLIGFKYAFLLNEFYGIRSGILIRNRSRCGIGSSDGVNLPALGGEGCAIFFLEFLSDVLWLTCFHRECHDYFLIIFQRLLSTYLWRKISIIRERIPPGGRESFGEGELRIFLSRYLKREFIVTYSFFWLQLSGG